MKQKGDPSYDIADIKSAFSSVEQLRMTKSAMEGQYELGFSDQDVVDVIQSLTKDDFYKSMSPKHPEFQKPQDVYTPVFRNVELYVKFQADKRGEMIVSFKER